MKVLKKFDRDTERKIKNIILYVIGIILFITSNFALFKKLISGFQWLMCLGIIVTIFTESDVTDLLEIYLNRG